MGEKRMTVKEVAAILGVEPETIKKHIRDLYPDLMRNGITTYLDEYQVTEIKRRMIPTPKVVGATTELEMAEKARDVLLYLTNKVEEQRAALALAAPKVESFNALMRSDQTMSITDAAKHFGLHPKGEVFPYLRERKYLTDRDLPTQAAIDAGYLALREVERRGDGKIIPQSCVLASQLETWRIRVVPQIAAWKAGA
jgi:phage antirepressor YoqD-like protein